MSRDGSVERRSGDREEHLHETISNSNSTKRLNRQNFYKNVQEDIQESKAYFSNDPNVSNLKRDLVANALRKEKNAQNDPIYPIHQYEFTDFENLNEIQESSVENIQSKYNSNFENYRSVGSINKSVKSPRNRPPKSGINQSNQK